MVKKLQGRNKPMMIRPMQHDSCSASKGGRERERERERGREGEIEGDSELCEGAIIPRHSLTLIGTTTRQLKLLRLLNITHAHNGSSIRSEVL